MEETTTTSSSSNNITITQTKRSPSDFLKQVLGFSFFLLKFIFFNLF